MSEGLESGFQALAARGFNLIAVLAVSRLRETAPEIVHRLPESYRTLILIGAGGKALWQALRRSSPGGKHPVDDFSRMAAHRVAAIWRLPSWWLLYPAHGCTLPLSTLGKMAGWHHDSPLGSGIHPNYGPWFAYRALLATDAKLPETRTQRHPSPCRRCHTKPCLGACPAGALRRDEPPGLSTCAAFRLQPESPCAARCLAREACPIGKNHAYESDQVVYHYSRSLRHLEANPPAHRSG